MSELDDLKLAVIPVVMNWDLMLRDPMSFHNWETMAGQMRGMADKIDRALQRESELQSRRHTGLGGMRLPG